MKFERIERTPSGRVRIRWLRPEAIRITHTRTTRGDFPPDRPWLEHILLPPSEMPEISPSLQVQVQQGCIQVARNDGTLIFREVHPPQMGIHRRRPYLDLDIPKTTIQAGLRRVEEGIRLSFEIQQGEYFYGWGEWFNAFQRERADISLRIRDAIALIQDRATYSGIPLFLSSCGYGLWLLNSHPSRWRIDPDLGEMQVEVDGPPADYVLMYGPEYKSILKSYTGLTGRPPLLPKWAFGLMVTGYPQEHQEVVLERIRKHREKEIPLDGVVLDYHWEERFHNFKWRRSIIPDPDGFIFQLDDLGVRLGLIQTPFVNKRSRPVQKMLLNRFARNIPPGLEADDERALPEYAQAKKLGYLAHLDAKWWFGAGGMVDFSNPSAADWWNSLMQPLYEQGVAFFKNDDGEYLPDNGVSALGMSGTEYHNMYGFYYGRALHKGMEARDERRGMIYARSAWAGSQRYPALFLGDQKPTFDGIRSTMRAGLNLGMLGFAYWTADVFGLDGETTPETHMRYAQWAMFVPVARYFWRPPEVDNTRFPWSHNEEVEASFRYHAQLRYRLLPYYYSLAWESSQTGFPIMRPLILEYQDDPRLAGIYDQVLLGESMMLCPVIEPGAVSRRIFLPPGTWHEFHDRDDWRHREAPGKPGILHGPGEIELPACPDKLPVLVRGGSIIPMGPPLQHIPDDHQFDPLQFHLWPPYPANGILYEDDGLTRSYQRGEYAITRVAAVSSEQSITVTLSASEGGYPEQPVSRRVDIILHHASKPARVTLDDQDCPYFIFDPECNILSIPFIHTTSSTTAIYIHA